MKLENLLDNGVPPELVGIKNGPINPGSALHAALGSSEYWYQKYCGLEKEIQNSGMRAKKDKRINIAWKVGFMVFGFNFIFATYQAIQYRHKAEVLEVLLQQVHQQIQNRQQ